MKYLVVSDIHGCKPALEKVLSFFRDAHYDRMLILGDVLNYGPRNGLPEGLDAMGIVKLLNEFKDKITAVRGNCDSEVDQMLLEFPMMADNARLQILGRNAFLTHGHLYKSPDYGSCDMYFSGHTHIWKLYREGQCIVCNTGSITFPKEGNIPTFATIEEDGCICIRNLEGEVIESLR